MWIIVGFFIPVSSLKVFGRSIHSERRMIYLGKSIQALQNDTIIISWICSGVSQQCHGIPLKVSCLFSSSLDHYKNFSRQSVIKVSNQNRTHDFQSQNTSQNFYMAKRVIGCTDAPNKGIEQACSGRVVIYTCISPFNIICTKPLAMFYWYLCWIVWCINQVNAV